MMMAGENATVQRVSQRARRLYEQQVRNLPIGERLQLVKLVIDELSNAAVWWNDEDEEWAMLGLQNFQQDWDNPDDAIYDNWREAYRVSDVVTSCNHNPS
jgi:hypothetical protein